MSSMENRMDLLERRLDDLDKRLRGLEQRVTTEQGLRPTVASAPPRPSVQAAPQRRATLLAPQPLESRPVPAAQRREATAAPAPVAPRPKVVAPARSWSAADLERLLTGRFLAWGGGLAILIGALFFLARAFREGWIGPSGRVAIGLGAGLVLFAVGARFFERREVLFGHVLVATGLGTLALTLVAATRLYDLIRVDIGLLCSLVLATASATIAVRSRSQVVAAYGLVTALAAPYLLGASPTSGTVAFVATALLGCTAVSLWRSWTWLPGLAFLLSAPQVWSWLESNPPSSLALVALATYWSLNALAAGGEEFRHRRSILNPSSAMVLLSNAAFVVAAGFFVLDTGDTAIARGLWLLAIAIAHMLLGGYFLWDESDDHPFGLLALGTGIAALTMAVPVALGGHAVPLAWAAEAAALAWIFSRRHDRYSAACAGLLALLAFGHFVQFEYPLANLLLYPQESPAPFLNANGGTLAFFLAALGFGSYVVRSRGVRSLLAWAGFGLALYALPFETSGLWLLGGYAATTVLALLLDRTSRPLRGVRAFRHADLALEMRVPALVAAVLAAGHALLVNLPISELGPLPAIPFTDSYTIAAVILVAAAVIGAVIAGRLPVRRTCVLVAVSALTWLMPFELPSAWVVVAWCALAAGLALFARTDRFGVQIYGVAAALLGGLAALLTFADVAPVERLAVRAYAEVDHPLLWSGATVALLSLAALLALGSRLMRGQPRATYLTLGAGVLLVYLLSVGVVDEFQRRVSNSTDLENLRKLAQVALSILWAALGGGAFIAGMVARVGLLRAAGLGLLAVATTKVFLYDLASLDATYRVPSFIGLGVLLLASSYAYQRLRPAADEEKDAPVSA